MDKGIPHDEFLSWEPESRAKTIAYLMEQGDTCQLCGTAKWEWEENPYAYDTEEAFCKGCYIKEVSAEGDRMPGTRIELVPVTRELRARQYRAFERRQRMDMH